MRMNLRESVRKRRRKTRNTEETWLKAKSQELKAAFSITIAEAAAQRLRHILTGYSIFFVLGCTRLISLAEFSGHGVQGYSGQVLKRLKSSNIRFLGFGFLLLRLVGRSLLPAASGEQQNKDKQTLHSVPPLLMIVARRSTQQSAFSQTNSKSKPIHAPQRTRRPLRA